jgi:hypothetical protein
MSNENTHLTGAHYGLAGVNHRALRNLIGNRCLNFVGLVIGSGTTSAVNYDAFDFIIGGRAYEQAAGVDEALTVLDYYGTTNVQAADTTCFYLVVIDAAGVEYTIKGKDDETTELPGVPDGYALMGIIKIVTVAVTFTIGTTAFDAAGITDTFYDYIHAPVTAP